MHVLLAHTQPPWDTSLDYAPGKPFYINHYTYGMDYTLEGEPHKLSLGWWPSCAYMDS